MDASSEWSRFGYFLVNVGLMTVSILLQRRVFLVFGALGAYGYLGYLSYDLFADSLWFPFALTALGASLIAGGVFYQRHRERIERAVRSWMGLRA
jgi:CHASE2 domain-containing sensor protein